MSYETNDSVMIGAWVINVLSSLHLWFILD